ARVLQALSTAYSAQGKDAEAAKALAEALQERQGSAQDYFTLGKLYATQNDPRSIEAFQKSVSLQPDLDQAWSAMSKELGKRRERIPEAVKIFENYVNLFPDKAFPRLLLGEAYFNLGNLERAIGQLKKA